ncbi:actin, clone 302-like [Saccostrea echinata]|uniref:actin, clone 302-like n=1 Tax=Saccostrea echinata TaxID=191078 RepID=UPI002A7F7FE5|nr:actin, clone 302-like [Saccostrea echinata]
MSETSLSDDEDVESVVIDNGSGTFLAGFGGDDSPTAVLRPSVIGKRRFQAELSDGDTYIGDKINKNRELLSLTYPVERGIVTNWDDMETIWRYAFERELQIKSEDRPVLMADATLNPIGNREKMIQVMMESFLVPAFQVMNQGILSMYASGRTSGTVVTVGEGVCHVDPIYEAVPDLLGRRRVELAGRDLTLHLQRLLHNKGYSFTSSAEIELVRDMKEKLCYVSFNVEKDKITSASSPDLDKSYTLPDGNKLTLSNERFMCPEALFQPSLLGLDFKGIHHLVTDSILACDICTRRDLFHTIILSGASTMFPGFHERFMHEITGLAPLPSKVIAPPERNKSAWLGGSIVASLSSFDKHLISKQEYEEFGPGIVHRKCRYY